MTGWRHLPVIRTFDNKGDDLFKNPFESFEVSDFFLDGHKLLFRDMEHLGRLRNRNVGKAKHIPDGADTESEAAGTANEQQAMDRTAIVAPLISPGPCPLGEKPDPFVVADRRDFDAGDPGEFADANIHVWNPLWIALQVRLKDVFDR